MIKMKLRSKIIIPIALILVIAVSVLSVNAEGWYCMRSGHDAPSLPAEFIYLEDFGGRYIDRTADEQNKVIYLTFDAGYENGNVEKILDVLSQRNVKAAFFVLENLILREPDLIRRMQKEGHTVANHTATHRDMTSVATKEEFAAELSRLEEVYKSTVGSDMPRIFRPPEGKINKKSLEFANELGYKTVMWSFAYADWDNDKQPDPEESVKRILDNTHNGMIILLHPTSATNAAIMGRLIDEWSEMGYRFGTLDELA